MSEITKGPWRYEPIDRDGIRVRDSIVGDGGAQIVEDVVHEADARAIALVPDMLDLIRDLVDAGEPYLDELSSRAMRLIAKAEGRA